MLERQDDQHIVGNAVGEVQGNTNVMQQLMKYTEKAAARRSCIVFPYPSLPEGWKVSWRTLEGFSARPAAAGDGMLVSRSSSVLITTLLKVVARDFQRKGKKGKE